MNKISLQLATCWVSHTILNEPKMAPQVLDPDSLQLGPNEASFSMHYIHLKIAQDY